MIVQTDDIQLSSTICLMLATKNTLLTHGEILNNKSMSCEMLISKIQNPNFFSNIVLFGDLC